MRLMLAVIALAACSDPTAMQPPELPGGPPRRACTTEFRLTPAQPAAQVAIAGEWNRFDPAAAPMDGPDPGGAWHARVAIDAGAWAYKFVVDGATWVLDPSNPYSKY